MPRFPWQPDPDAPRIPRLEFMASTKFISNYFLQGCEAPFWLWVEGAQDGLADLALLLLLPTGEDIIQGILDPNNHKDKRAARHGRDWRKQSGFPDVSDAAARNTRAAINPNNVLAGRKGAYVFTGINAVEGVNFSAAVIEGLADTHFQGIWGVIQSGQNPCEGLEYLWRTDDSGITAVGVLPWHTPLGVDTLQQNRGFFSPDGFGWNTIESDYTVFIVAKCVCLSSGGCREITPEIYGDDGKVYDSTTLADMDQGEEIDFNLQSDIPAGIKTWFSRTNEFGSVRFDRVEVFAFNKPKQS